MFKRFAVVAGLAVSLALPLGSCSTPFGQRITAAYQAVTQATISPEAVILAASAFDTVEITATNYVRLRRCTGSNGPICRDPKLMPTIKGAVYAGRVARNNLKAFLRTHPGQLGPQGDYDALVSATRTLRDATAAYAGVTQ